MQEAGGFAILKNKGSEGSSTLKSIIRVASSSSSSGEQSAENSSIQAFPITNAGRPGQVLERLQELQRLIEQTADAS
jgi:hypothetical protein